MKDHSVPPNACLNCGRVNDCAAGPFCDDAPKAHDLTICLKCGLVMAYDADLNLRKVSLAELDTLNVEIRRQIGIMQRWVRTLNAQLN